MVTIIKAAAMINSQFKKTTLENGINIVTDTMPNVRSVSIGVWIRAGSRDENIANNGISHFLEHMLFKGTKKRSAKQIAQSLESSGGSMNGATGKEVSCYTAFVLDEKVPLAIDVLADILLNSRLLKRDIENEKNVVLSEINHFQEEPDEMVFEHFYKQLFPDHPLGFFIYGTAENVVNFSRSDLTNFLKETYTADKTVVAAAGNLNHQQIVDLVSEKFTLPPSSQSTQLVAISKNYTNERIELLSSSSQQAHICIGARTFPYSDNRKYAIIALEVLLGGGMSSRLFQNIREKYGFAYSVYAFTDFMNDTGVFGFYLACAQDKVEKSLDLLHKELGKIRQNSIKEEELERIKSQIKGGLLLSLESSSRRMRRIGEVEVYDAKHLSLEELVNKVDEIKVDDLVRLANEFLDETHLATTIIMPSNGH